MKVGTDAVLLGAWAEVPKDNSAPILEVGCGSGVISLMVAQKANGVRIMGIDIHKPSVLQARENLRMSPFCNVEFMEADFLSLPENSDFIGAFSTIISNPPYHTESLLSPATTRAAARSEHFLPFPDFARTSSVLLKEGGHLQVIIPTAAEESFMQYCNANGLYVSRALYVRTTQSKPARRVLLDFIKVALNDSSEYAASIPPNVAEILISDSSGMRSKAYSELCKEYYL